MPKRISDFTGIAEPSDAGIVYVVDSTEDVVDRQWSVANVFAWIRTKFAAAPVAITEGGTGAATAAGARTALDLAGDDNTSHYHDTRYYTESELDAGQLDTRYYTETELDAGQLDTRYYTETELDAGQLDNRYFTETESDARFLLETNNLSDLVNVATARTNLGLGTAALVDTGTGATDVATVADADARYLLETNNLSDLTDASAARTNLGLGSLAVLSEVDGGDSTTVF